MRRASTRARRFAGSPWVRVAGSAVAVYLFVRSVDLGEAVQRFSHVDPGWTVLAVVLAALSVVASVAEWGVFLRGTGHELDWSFLGSWYLKGLFVNQVLPAGVGSDAMRTLQMGRLTGHGPMVASLVASRMAGTLGMASWALAAAIFLRGLIHVPALAGFVTFAFLMCAAWISALLAERVRRRIPEHRQLAHSIGRLLYPFTGCFDDYLARPTIVVQSILAGCVGWGLNLFSMEAFSVALGHPVSWEVFAVALPVALLATFVPISANGLGVREGVVVVLLARTGVPVAQAAALSLFVDVQMLPFAVLGGLVFLAEHGHLHHPVRLARRLGARVMVSTGQLTRAPVAAPRSEGSEPPGL